MSIRIPNLLKDAISQRKCVAFVGAGFSMPCGMPSWFGLLNVILEESRNFAKNDHDDKLIEDLSYSLEQGDLMLAVSIARQIYKGGQLDTIVTKTFAREVFDNAPEDKKNIILSRLDGLLNTPWAGIITTNYDDLIEMGLNNHKDMPTKFLPVDNKSFGNSLVNCNYFTRFFVKLHGSVGNENYVLGTEEYDHTYLTSRKVSTFLSSVMLNYHLVFIGCSLEDEILRLRRRLVKDFDNRIPMAYTFCPDTRRNLARMVDISNSAHIQTVAYDQNDHSSVEKFLLGLKEDSQKATEANTNKVNIIEEEIKAQPFHEKLQSIGTVNEKLFQYIALLSKDRKLSQMELIQSIRAEKSTAPDQLIHISDSEIVFRVLFLTNILLLEVSKDSNGTVSYSALESDFKCD